MRDKIGQLFCPQKSVCKIDSSDVVIQGEENKILNKTKILKEFRCI